MSMERILTQLLGSGVAPGLAGGLAGGLASGLLTSKAGRKVGKQALRLGGIAAVGGLAYAAWQRYQAAQAGTGGAVPRSGLPRIEATAFLPPPDTAATETLGMTLVRAMIAAAQADGRLDGAERRAVFERVATLDLSDEEKAALFAQLEHPVDLGALVAAATTREMAVEIYAASVLAIESDTAAERGYLAVLAARLELPDELVAAIHREAAVTAEAAAPAPVADGAPRAVPARPV